MVSCLILWARVCKRTEIDDGQGQRTPAKKEKKKNKKNYNSKKEDNKEKDQREDERNVIL